MFTYFKVNCDTVEFWSKCILYSNVPTVILQGKCNFDSDINKWNTNSKDLMHEITHIAIDLKKNLSMIWGERWLIVLLILVELMTITI
jgi:hypothetical protein